MQQLEDLFHAARAVEPARRAAFLDEACGDDAALRQELEALLSEDEETLAPFGPLAQQVAPAQTEQSLAGKSVSHFEIKSLLGKGGMGEVWLAQDTLLGRRVALKLLPPEFTQDAELVRRFELEARAASALNHPNIITIHEIGQTDNLHFIATEYIEGETLRQRLRRGPLDLSDALDAASQAAAALSAAHNAGIIHRDIKPENLMLRPDGYLKVLDFGLARVTHSLLSASASDHETPGAKLLETQPGTVLGTVSYMPPEQVRGEKVDARADIWSLGVVLYEMLAGVRPFTGKTAPEVFVAILEHQPLPLSKYLPEVAPQLERLIATALAKDRTQRFDTCQQLADELKALKRQLEFLPAPARVVVPVAAAEEQLPLSQVATVQTAVGHAIPLTNESELETVLKPASAAVAPKPARQTKVWLRGLAAVLVLAMVGWLVWRALRPAPPATPTVAPPTTAALPERTATYWLTVQKVDNGRVQPEQFESAGGGFFLNGWRFRFNFSSPQAGYLYLLNEGPAAKGKIVFQYLFPTPANNKGSAQVSAAQSLQTGWNFFDKNQGTEKFWLVWAAQPVSQLDEIYHAVIKRNEGRVTDPQQMETIRTFLGTHAAAAQREIDEERQRTTVKARSEFLVNRILLEHR